MPKSTFDNLPTCKKERVISAAVDEFAKRRFSEASINQIVKAAGISRGSFYQYFSGLEDIYLHVLKMIGDEKLAAISAEGDAVRGADFFETYERMFRFGLKWAQARPKYGRIGYLMRLDDSELVSGLKGLSDTNVARLAGLLEEDKRNGLVKPGADSALVVEMLQKSLAAEEVLHLYEEGNECSILDRLARIIGILKEGIQVVQG